MPYLEINPSYRDLLEQQGLSVPEDFLKLPAVIISGHPDRNVSRVVLGAGDDAVPAFLKREHRIPWKERFRNACAGFGFVSKSRRECKLLQSLAEASIGCAEWIAAGEDGQGRAFLLLRESESCQDLRMHLRDQLSADPGARRRFAQRLGAALAHLHDAGFDHPDLYAKHILVNRQSLQIQFLDMQRSRQSRHVAWRQRWRDLAALDATLTEELLPTRDRLVCLRAYLRTYRRDRSTCLTNVLHSACRILDMTKKLLRQRRVQEIRHGSYASGNQRLVWLDGEALCVTPEFQAALGGRIPDWLRLDRLPRQPGSMELHDKVVMDGTQEAWLVRRRQTRVLAGLWNWIRRRRLDSPELRMSGLIFRLQRAGIDTPRLLAFGHRPVSWCRTESFLLTDSPEERLAMTESLWQRITRGARRTCAQADWLAFVEPNWVECIMGVHVTDHFHSKQGRSTGRWLLQSQGRNLAVYLKRHYDLPWWRGLLAALWPNKGWSPAIQEWRHLEWARNQGLPVPRAVAAVEYIGPWGRLQSFLAVEELTGMVALHEAVPAAARNLDVLAFGKWKCGLIAELARLTRALHERRHFHKDLYLCHFFIPKDCLTPVPNWRGQVHLIDLHRLGHHGWSWPVWLIKDLAQLLYSTEIEGIHDRDRLRFWRAYWGEDWRGRTAQLLKRCVRFKWRRYRRHNLKKAQRLAAEPIST